MANRAEEIAQQSWQGFENCSAGRQRGRVGKAVSICNSHAVCRSEYAQKTYMVGAQDGRRESKRSKADEALAKIPSQSTPLQRGTVRHPSRPSQSPQDLQFTAHT